MLYAEDVVKKHIILIRDIARIVGLEEVAK
jgi:hypothetical protein